MQTKIDGNRSGRRIHPYRHLSLPRRAAKGTPGKTAFTLVELLVAMSITLLLMVLVMQILGFSSNQWKQVLENTKAFQGARAAFESLTRNLSQAVLATEYDYYDASRRSRLQIATLADAANKLSTFTPAIYGRSSALHFISGKNLIADQHTHSIFFQAPLDFEPPSDENPSGQLNAIGYFIHYGNDAANRPPNLSSSSPEPRTRFRLMQYLQPSSTLDVYRDSTGTSWFSTEAGQSVPVNAHILAENIVVLALLPKLPDEQGKAVDAIAPFYEYNSRTPWTSGAQPIQMHQLPPVVRVLMVAIDEVSAQRDSELGKSFRTLFTDPNKFADDLNEVETELRERKVNYRVFQADVPIRSAKWSQ